MHEMSIAEQLLEQVLTVSAQHGANRVSEVEVEIGLMRQVVPEALEMAFNSLCEGTIAEKAHLVQVEIPIGARCLNCGREFQAEIGSFRCPQCGDANVKIITGDDIILKSVVCDQ